MLLILSFFITGHNAYGQSEAERNNIVERVKEKVKQLNDDISFIANPQKEANVRYFYQKQAQKLFINNCDSYKEIVEYSDGYKQDSIRRDGVTMDVSSIRNGKESINTKPMKRYFNGLRNLGYDYVKIESTDIEDMHVSTLRPYGKDENGNMLYVCSVYFEQRFIARRREGRGYEDVTHKWAVCYVSKHEVVSETGSVKAEYMVRLGDIHVKSTKKLF